MELNYTRRKNVRNFIFLSLVIKKALAENVDPPASIEILNTRKQNFHSFIIRTIFLIDIIKKELDNKTR